MALDFLTVEQAARYGRYQGDPSPEQLTQFFTLSDADRSVTAGRRRPESQLGFAVQLGTLRFLGTFLSNPQETPAVVVEHVAQQLGLPRQEFVRYALRAATRHQHRKLILDHLEYLEFDGFQAFRLNCWLYAQLKLSAMRPSVLFDLATAHLIAQRIVLPGVSTLARLISRIRERYTARTYTTLSKRLSPEQRMTLTNLLTVPETDWMAPLERLRTPPDRISALPSPQKAD